jgi:hypothetical protein
MVAEGDMISVNAIALEGAPTTEISVGVSRQRPRFDKTFRRRCWRALAAAAR